MPEWFTRTLARFAHTRWFQKLLSALEKMDRPAAHSLRVLTYHRIADPSAFAQQMAYLQACYTPVSTPSVLQALRHGDPLPPRAVLVTFDDAYTNFARLAWPVLKQHNIPATLFVPTAYPDQPERVFWWDRLYQALHQTDRRTPLSTPAGRLPLATASQRRSAYRRLRRAIKSMPHAEAMALVDRICDELQVPTPGFGVLGWDALRRLAREGITLGAHTQTHPLLNRVSLAEARAEIVGSQRDLEREIGVTWPIFAYPAGGYTPAVVALLAAEGFQLAFTTHRGDNYLGYTPALQLRRNNIGYQATVGVLRLRLLQSYFVTGLIPRREQKPMRESYV